MFVVLWILPDEFDVLSKPLLLVVCGTVQPLLRADSIRFSLSMSIYELADCSSLQDDGAYII